MITTPDPSPRCGGAPGSPAPVFINTFGRGQRSCPGCADCDPQYMRQPAPIPSGDAALAAFNEKMWGLGPTDEVEAEAISEFETAIRAESAEALRDAQFTIRTQMEALQEARQQLSAATRELSALSSDAQTLMTAVTHWRERAEAAEERLREARDGWRLANEAAERLLPIANRAEAAEAEVAALRDDNERLRGLVNRIHPLAEGLAIRCEILESARDGRLSAVSTEDLNKHAGDTSGAIYAALDRILAETNAPAAPRPVPATTHPLSAPAWDAAWDELLDRAAPAVRRPQYGDVTASGFKYGCFDCEDDKPHAPHTPTPAAPEGPTGAVDDLLVEMAARIGGLTARLPDADAEDRVYVNTLVARVRIVRAALGSTPGGDA